MKKIRKIFAIMLVLTMVFTLAACGGSGQSAQEADREVDAGADQPASEPETVESEVMEPEDSSPEPAEADSEANGQENSQSEALEEPSPEGEIGAAAESPSTEIPKETAYTSGATLVTGTDEEEVFYDLEFEDGVLTAVYYEDNEGKGGWGGDSGVDLEDSQFYGMTVEESVESLKAMNLKVEIR